MQTKNKILLSTRIVIRFICFLIILPVLLMFMLVFFFFSDNTLSSMIEDAKEIFNVLIFNKK